MSATLKRISFLHKHYRIKLNQHRFLNLQEYQSKQLLRGNGCTVQDFFVAEKDDPQFNKKFEKFVHPEYVVKAQILAGGRGRGHFIDSKNGPSGIFITTSRKDASNSAMKMLGRRLVTKQTRKDGVQVNKVMLAESVPISKETYLAILLDRCSNGPMIIASPAGGMDIEEVAEKNPELLLKEPIDIETGITKDQCQKIARFLGFSENLVQDAATQIERLYKLFINVDATQIEINPFAETSDNRVFCIDAKLNFDDHAAFRQKEVFAMGSEAREEENELEIRAEKARLNYIPLDGNIGCMVNGAGLAMATMDIIKLHGGEPANFLDVGGGATVEQVTEAFKIITADRNVNAIFVNIFGGIMKCDVIAQGVIKAAGEPNLRIPIVVRLLGTRVAEAKALISANPHLRIFSCDSFDEATRLVVKLGKEHELDNRKQISI